jgi:CBS domain-containing protein
MVQASKIDEQKFFLSDILGRKVICNGKKIGSLQDIIVLETKTLPEISYFIVSRPFGYPSIYIPWQNIVDINEKEIVINIDDILDYEKDITEGQILLKDYLLDKKVIDMDENDVEVVYDIKLAIRNKKMYVTDVDSSKNGLLRRIGLKWLANLIYKLADKIKTETIPWTYVQPLPEKLSSFKGNVRLNILKDKLHEMHPVDLADIMEELDHEQMVAIFNELDTELASDTLEEIEPRVQRDLISSLENGKVVELINDMTPAQAADILAVLPTMYVDELIKHLYKFDSENAKKIEFILDKQDEKIINLATSHYFKFSPEITVEKALDEFHNEAKDKDVIMYVYVVDDEDHLLGVVDIRELLKSDLNISLKDIMTTHVISLNPDSTLIEVSRIFSRYSFRALPIEDEDKKILGVIPYKDVMNLKHRFI